MEAGQEVWGQLVGLHKAGASGKDCERSHWSVLKTRGLGGKGTEPSQHGAGHSSVMALVSPENRPAFHRPQFSQRMVKVLQLVGRVDLNRAPSLAGEGTLVEPGNYRNGYLAVGEQREGTVGQMQEGSRRARGSAGITMSHKSPFMSEQS